MPFDLAVCEEDVSHFAFQLSIPEPFTLLRSCTISIRRKGQGSLPFFTF